MRRKDIALALGGIFLLTLLSGLLLMVVGDFYYANSQYEILSRLTEQLINKYPNDEADIIGMIKETRDTEPAIQTGREGYLSLYGYEARDFATGYLIKGLLVAMVATSLAFGLAVVLLMMVRKNNKKRIEELTNYLESLNLGRAVTILPHKEDDFSKIQDEIYKTVTMLYQTREAAVTVKENYADNLANIAHQMKTPLTAMSLMTQLLKAELKSGPVEALEQQLERLIRLEEALLLLSRIDAGVLELEKERVDVYTMLQLSVEGLEELTTAKNLEIKLKHQGSVFFVGDMEWSIEAFSNLIKNCLEHAISQVTIEYQQNPLYTEIKIWDDGAGFDRQDWPHIFERFYRGSNIGDGGIGIGLTLAKSLVVMQNGCIEAINRSAGGACFAVRFYSH